MTVRFPRPHRFGPLFLIALAFLLVRLPATAQVTFTDIAAGDLVTPVRSWGASFVDVDADGDPWVRGH